MLPATLALLAGCADLPARQAAEDDTSAAALAHEAAQQRLHTAVQAAQPGQERLATARRALESLGRTNDLFGRGFGRANRSELLETINGVSRDVALQNGRSIVALSEDASSVNVRASSETTALFARWETLYDRPATAQQEGPVSLALQGDVGYSGERAALDARVALFERKLDGSLATAERLQHQQSDRLRPPVDLKRSDVHIESPTLCSDQFEADV